MIKRALQEGRAQSEDGIQPQWGPAHAKAPGTGADDGFAGNFSDPTSHVHALCPKGGGAHALGVGTERVRFDGGNASGGSWLRSNGRQSVNGSLRASICPWVSRSQPCAAPSEHGMGDLPHLFARVPEIHHVSGGRKLFVGHIPDPGSAISQDHVLIVYQSVRSANRVCVDTRSPIVLSPFCLLDRIASFFPFKEAHGGLLCSNVLASVRRR